MSRSEFDIITHYFSHANLGFAAEGVALGIGDDGAVLSGTGDSALSMSMDMLVGNVHFPASAPARAIATRALAVNLSDLAAMSAKPLCFTLGLAVPELNEPWLKDFSEGLSEMAQRFHCPLVGGDLTRTAPDAPLTIAIQVHGLHGQSKPVLRSGAKPGDDIYVTGKIGDGALALLSLGLKSRLDFSLSKPIDRLSSEAKKYFYEAFYQPEPRVGLGLALGNSINSSIDISDGLMGDLGHILKASNVAAVIESESLPYSDYALDMVSKQSCLIAALFGGDDYELCFTASSGSERKIKTLAKELAVEVTKVGKIVEGSGVSVISGQGQVLDMSNQAYDHFRETAA